MGALILGIVLIIGYHYQSHHPIRRLELIRSTGYHIYFKAGFSGFVLLCVASGIWLLLDYLNILSYLPVDAETKQALVPNKDAKGWEQLAAVVIFVTMFLISSLYILLRKLSVQKNKEVWLGHILEVAHELEGLLILATSQVQPIRVELDCGKVYVGIPETPNLEKGEVKYFNLLPLLSGYSDETKKIVFTNNYERHYRNKYGQSGENSAGHESVYDFSIVIPVEQVVVASQFNLDDFIRFQQEEKTPLAESTSE